MVRRSLFAAAFFLAAAPLTAQNQQNPVAGPAEYQWSSDRPDAVAPIGTFGAHLMPAGEFEVSYRFHQTNWQGVYLGSDSLPGSDVARLFDDVPRFRRNEHHQVRVMWGLSEDFTLIARSEYVLIQRETVHNFQAGPSPIRSNVSELGDTEVGALYRIYAEGPYRLHVHGGAIIPTGKSVTYADTSRTQNQNPVSLPYDMRTGHGTFGLLVGVSGNAQNEFGSVGGQFRFRTDFADNDAGFRPGDQYEGNVWAAYKLNQMISLSGGLRYESYRPIDGQDVSLNPFGDPHNAAPDLSGKRAHMPLGMNFRMPEGHRFAGHAIGLEAVYTLHHDMDGPQLGMDWGFNFGYTFAF